MNSLQHSLSNRVLRCSPMHYPLRSIVSLTKRIISIEHEMISAQLARKNKQLSSDFIVSRGRPLGSEAVHLAPTYCQKRHQRSCVATVAV
eukprot:6202887-Pleurochrysis_carterae.AAC.1